MYNVLHIIHFNFIFNDNKLMIYAINYTIFSAKINYYKLSDVKYLTRNAILS